MGCCSFSFSLFTCLYLFFVVRSSRHSCFCVRFWFQLAEINSGLWLLAVEMQSCTCNEKIKTLQFTYSISHCISTKTKSVSPFVKKAHCHFLLSRLAIEFVLPKRNVAHMRIAACYTEQISAHEKKLHMFALLATDRNK